MLKIIYAGTPEFAVPALQALAQSEHRLVGVYTQPDRPAGRGRRLQAGPVKLVAEQLGIPVLQPVSFKESADVQQLVDLQPDLMVVAAYGLILSAEVLQIPRLGCINIHASLLPRWRGAAPIQRAILAGDSETGITIMQMDEGLDSGTMLARQAVTIDPEWSAGELHDRLKQVGAELLMPTIGGLIDGSIRPERQNKADVTYAAKLSKPEAEVDWRKDSASIHREIRAFSPWPVSYTQFEGQSVRIWRANHQSGEAKPVPAGTVVEHTREGIFVSCGSGILQITELQFAGRKVSSAEQVLNARSLKDLRFG